MNEIHVVAEESPKGAYIARAVANAISTEADDLSLVREQVHDAVRCHVEDADRPSLIRLHITREEGAAA
jgi:hypothetical protein